MEGLNLGAAFFNFALNSTQAVKGLADFAGSVSGTTSKVVPQVKGISDGFGAASEKMAGTLRGMERFSRGMRGVAPEVAAARENIYRLEDSMKRLGREVEIGKLRLKERQEAERLSIQTGADLNRRLNEQRREMGLTSDALGQAKLKLHDLTTSTKLNIEAVAAQEIKFKEADSALEVYQRRMVETRDKVAAMLEREKNFNLELDQQAGKILTVQQRLSGMTTEMQQHEDEVVKLTAKLQNENEVMQLQYAEINRLKESSKNFYDQARVEGTKLKQLQERNIKAEVEREEGKYRQLAAAQRQHQIKANKLAQELSTMAKSGPNGKLDPAYRDKQLEQQRMMAQQQTEIQQLEVMKGSIAALRIEQQGYNNVLAKQSSFVETLNAKAAEESAQARKLTGDLKLKQATFKGLTTDIQTHRDAIAKLGIEQTNLTMKEVAERNALKTLEAEQQASVNKRKTLEAEMEKQVLKSNELAKTYQREQQALDDLKKSGGASAADIKKQEAAVEALEKAWEKERNELQSVERATEKNALTQQRLALEVKSAEKSLTDMAGTQEKLGAQMGVAAAREAKAVEAAEKKKSALDKLKVTLRNQSGEVAKTGHWFEWLASLFARGTQKNEQYAGSMRKTIGVQQAFNMGLAKSGTLFQQFAVGTLSSAAGNFISDWATGLRSAAGTGLEAYKSHEMLAMSLKALSQRQMVAEGSFKSLGEAEGAAGEKAEKLIKWMDNLAIQSPFSVEDISGAFRLGNALGFTAEQAAMLIKNTVDWGSATGATGQQLEQVMRAMGQMNSAGKVSLEDINQLTDAGLGARDVLRAEFAPEIKKSKKSLEDLISAGLIPADRAIQAMSQSMADDFGGSAAKAGNSMTGLIASLGDIKKAGLRELFSSTFEAIKKPLTRFVSFLQAPSTLQGIRDFGAILGQTVVKALTWLSNVGFPAAQKAVAWFVPRVVEAFSFLAALGSEAWEWGYSVGAMFQEGLAATINSIVEVISWIGETISYWMEPHSPPKFLPNIDKWGKKTAETYWEGFKEADSKSIFAGWGQKEMSIFSDMKGKISGVLGDMVDVGSIDKGVMTQVLIGSEGEMANAINELKQFGSVSEATFQRIQQAAGPAAAGVMDYFRAMLQNEAATMAVEKAQAALNAITKEYDAKIDPLKKKLDALHGKSDDKGAAKEKAYLEELLTLQNSEGLEMDKDAIRQRIQELDLEREIAAQEEKKDAALDAAQVKLDAAQAEQEAAARNVEYQETLIAMQKEQIDLVKQQMALEKGEDGSKTPEEIAKEDAAAKEQYEFNKASTDEQIALLEAKQSKEREGSAKWFDLQEQIDRKREELNDHAEKGAEDLGKEQDKLAKEEEKRQKAEMETRLAAAETEEERLTILQEAQAKAEPGTIEYINLQKRIEQQEDKVGKATERRNKELARASEEEFDNALALADKGEKVGMLQERLAALDPTTAEYSKRQIELKKAEEESAKGTKQLTDAEFEAAYAAQDKAGKIEMLREKMEGLDKTSLEYLKTAKKLNALENQSGGGGSKLKAPKLPAGGGSGIKGLNLDSVGDSVNKVTTSVSKVTEAVDKAKKKFQEFRDKLAPTFEWLKQNSGIIAYVLQKLAVSFAVALVLDKVAKPIFNIVWAFRSFVTWSNALWLAIAFLGYAWRNNIGGMRDIVFDTWAKIQAPLQGIKAIIDQIAQAFQTGGFGAAWEMFQAKMGDLGTLIGSLGSTVWAGIVEWTGPFVEFMGKLFEKVSSWATGGGITRAFTAIVDAIAAFFTNEGTTAVVGSGILGLIGGLSMVVGSLVKGIAIELVKAWPALEEAINAGWKFIGDWFSKYSFLIMPTIQTALLVAVGGLAEFLIPAIVFLGKRIIDVAAWLIPMIPSIIAGLLNTIMLLTSWLIGRGVPLVLAGLWDLLAYAFDAVGKMLPNLGLNLGLAIGSVISTLFVAVVGAIGGLIGSLVLAIYDGSLLVRLKAMANGIGTFFKGLALGIINLVIGLLLGLVEPLVNVGRALILGLGEGWTGGVADFFRSLVAGFDYVIGMVKQYLGIQSPSTVFAEIGTFLIDGLLVGLQKIAEVATWLIGKWLEINLFILQTVVNTLAKVIEGVIGFVNDLETNFKAMIDWVTINFQKFVDWFLALFGTNRTQVIAVVTDLKDKAVAGFTKLRDDATELINKMVANIIAGATKARDDAMTAINALKDLAAGAWNSMVTTAGNLWTGAGSILSKISDGATQARDKVKEFFAGDGDGSIKGIIGNVWDWIISKLGGGGEALGNAMKDALMSARRIMIDAINSVIDSVNDAISAINDLSSAVGVPPIDKIDRLEYALGAQLTKAGFALVGENGPEMVQMPGGASVTPASRTMAMFEDSAARMIADVTRSLDAAMTRMEKSQEKATASLERAATRSAEAGAATATTTTITNNNQVTHETHHHWSMTVNTQATTGTVVDDFATMQAYSTLA